MATHATFRRLTTAYSHAQVKNSEFHAGDPKVQIMQSLDVSLYLKLNFSLDKSVAFTTKLVQIVEKNIKYKVVLKLES